MSREWEGVADKLYKQGKRDFEIAKECGVSPKSVYIWRLKNGYKSNQEVNPDDKPNPCPICQRNIADCPWLHEHKPVPGWDAVLLVKQAYMKREKYEYMTWAIKNCPLYIPPEDGREMD